MLIGHNQLIKDVQVMVEQLGQSASEQYEEINDNNNNLNEN